MLFWAPLNDGRSRTSLPFGSQCTFSVIFNSEIQINQERRSKGIISILINQEVINGNVSIEDTNLAQGLIPFDMGSAILM